MLVFNSKPLVLTELTPFLSRILDVIVLMFEVEGYIKRYPQHTIIFTGGDAFYFAHKIKNTVFATQDMVLQGLAFIADYYIKK